MTVTDADFEDPAFKAQLETLRQHYLEGLPARRTAFVEAWHGCVDGDGEVAWLSLCDVAHKLSGSAPCYGLEALGVAARELDKLLSGKAPSRTRAQVADVVVRVQGLLDAAVTPG